MNYYYDLKVNFQKNNCSFYEWCNNDNIEIIKKIPIIHVSGLIMDDILTNKININKKLINFDNNQILFVDRNSAIVIRFDSNGIELYRSSLMIDDEIYIVEMAWNYKNQDVEYKKIERIIYKKELRNDEYIKELICKEIKNSIENKKYSKLKYLYLEWFNEKPTNSFIRKIKEKIKKGITSEELEIYNFIMLGNKK